MAEKRSVLFNNDGVRQNAELVDKPLKCVSCKKNDDPSEEVFCILNRLGQQDSGVFSCSAFQASA